MELTDILLDKLQRYFDGQMADDELQSFEAQIDNDKELQQFIAAFQQNEQWASEDGWTIASNTQGFSEILSEYRTEDSQNFSYLIQKTAERYHKESRSKKGDRRFWFIGSTAAAVLALLLYLAWPNTWTTEEAYNQYNSWDELPALTVKSDASTTDRKMLEQSFRDEKYDQAVSIVQKLLLESKNLDPDLLIYQGVAQLETDDFKGAINTFTQLTESTSLDAHKGYWYLALTHLKKGDREMVIQQLEFIIKHKDNYRYKDAQYLYKKLK